MEQLIPAIWLPLTEDNMPPENELVFVQRYNNSIYVAFRQGNALSKNTDPSRDCYWYGNSIHDTQALYGDRMADWQGRNNFSDVTVKYWMPIPIPAPAK